MTHSLVRGRVAATLVCSLLAVLSACKNQETKKTETKSEAPPHVAEPAKEQPVQVKLTTSMGDIVLELDDDKAPISTENFLQYVNSGHYDGTIFHRVIDGFMIQGGGFTPDMNQKPTGQGIKNEWQNGLKNNKYTIAMARLGNRPDSATAQFFINVADNAFLDQPRDGAGYAVFGHVVAGQDIVDKIGIVKTTDRAGMGDVPATPVVIQKAEQISGD